MWDIDATGRLLREMSATTEPDELLQLLLAHLRRSLHVERAIVLSRDGLEFPFFRVVVRVEWRDDGCSRLVEDTEFANTGGLFAQLLYAGQVTPDMAISVTEADPSYGMLRGFHSLAAFPLFDHGESRGMVILLGITPGCVDQTAMCGLAIMGALLQRTSRERALAHELQATCRALDAELAAAASVQRWLLPPSGSASSAVGVASSYVTARHAGGDYYDCGELPGGLFGVMIADVSGHGAAAAVLMAILRTIVHDEIDRSRVVGPAALLDYADSRLCALGLASRGSFVTAFSGTLDTATGEFRYSCAGHPPPRLRRARNGAVFALDGASTAPLGVLEERPHRYDELITLEPGDLLVFYSDGVTEARSPGGEFFGVSRLDRVLRELPQQPLAEMAIDAIREAVRGFSGVGPPSDDQTLVAVHWRGQLECDVVCAN